MKPLIEVKDLKKNFETPAQFLAKKKPPVQALQNISLKVFPGETLGLVGESGCGKSTLGRCMIRLLDPTAGEIFYNGHDITHTHGQELRQLRKDLQIIFQDPYASLNPRMTVAQLLKEPLIIHKLASSPKDQEDRCKELLDLVGLGSDALSKYPHEFSGGQRQRIGIARALAVEPRFIVCDEPVSALDVSIQAQIINLLMDLQQKLELTYLFVAHDLKVVEHISSRVAVMYLGQIMELAEAEELYTNPKHPYTQALLSAIPVPLPPTLRKNGDSEAAILSGDVPSPANPPSGCPFHTRCPKVYEKCHSQLPALESLSLDPSVTSKKHESRCWRTSTS